MAKLESTRSIETQKNVGETSRKALEGLLKDVMSSENFRTHFTKQAQDIWRKHDMLSDRERANVGPDIASASHTAAGTEYALKAKTQRELAEAAQGKQSQHSAAAQLAHDLEFV